MELTNQQKIEAIQERMEVMYENKTYYYNDIQYLLQRLERYEKALQFYADEQNYDKWTYGVERVTNVTRDKGNVAKEALKEEKRGGLVNPDGGDYPLKWMSEPKE